MIWSNLRHEYQRQATRVLYERRERDTTEKLCDNDASKNIFSHKIYKLFDLTKLTLILPTFRLIQQSLSRTS